MKSPIVNSPLKVTKRECEKLFYDRSHEYLTWKPGIRISVLYVTAYIFDDDM